MLEIKKNIINDIPCLKLIGRVDGVTSHELEEEYSKIFETGGYHIENYGLLYDKESFTSRTIRE